MAHGEDAEIQDSEIRVLHPAKAGHRRMREEGDVLTPFRAYSQT